MDIIFRTRPFYPDELRAFKTLKVRKEREARTAIRYHYFLIAVLLGTLFAYITELLPKGIWTFIFGTLSVISFGFIVFGAYEIFKTRRNNRAFLKSLNSVIETGTVNTVPINATRIAVAKEYEDEGDLFIIEPESNKVLYMWDYDFNLRKKFPCLDFEIYDDDFFRLLGRQIYPKSDRIKPLIIDKNIKWKYFKQNGNPGHLQIENKSLDTVIQDINNCA